MLASEKTCAVRDSSGIGLTGSVNSPNAATTTRQTTPNRISWKILLITPPASQCSGICEQLAQLGHQVSLKRSIDEIRNAFQQKPDLVLIDLNWSAIDTVMSLIRGCREHAPSVPWLVAANTEQQELAFKAVGAGAADYICTPFDAKALLFRASRVMYRTRLENEVRTLRHWVRSTREREAQSVATRETQVETRETQYVSSRADQTIAKQESASLCEPAQQQPDDRATNATPEVECLFNTHRPFEATLAEVEKEAIIQTLRTCRGNKAKAARSLGISEKSIYNKMRRLDVTEYRVREKFTDADQ